MNRIVGGLVFLLLLLSFYCAEQPPRASLASHTFWLKGDGRTDDTAGLQAALDAQDETVGPILLPPGIFLFSTLTINGNHTRIIGSGYTKTILKMMPGANVGIRVATTGMVYNLYLADLQVQGTDTSVGGFQLGTSFDPPIFAAGVRLERVYINGCAAGYGVSLQSCQNVHATDCLVSRNKWNIYRPETGRPDCTTVVFDGSAASIGKAYDCSVYLAGAIQPLTFLDQTLGSDDVNEAIRVRVKGWSGLRLHRCYFEAANTSGKAQAVIDVSGSEFPGRLTFRMDDCEFHAPSRPAGSLRMDYVHAVIQNNISLLDAGPITTTGNTTAMFRNNGTAESAQDYRRAYAGLVGHIYADDIDKDGQRFSVGGRPQR